MQLPHLLSGPGHKHASPLQLDVALVAITQGAQILLLCGLGLPRLCTSYAGSAYAFLGWRLFKALRRDASHALPVRLDAYRFALAVRTNPGKPLGLSE